MKIRWEEESKEYNEDRISNKVIFLRVGAIILIIIVLILFIVLIYKSLKIINKDNESEVIETTIIETKKKKSLVTLKEKRKVVVEEKAEDNNKDNEISIFKYVDNLKRRINKQSSKEISNDIVVDIKSSGEEEKKVKERPISEEAIYLQELFDENFGEKDMWYKVDIDGDGIGYNYYFNKDGILLTDTITPDYRYVDINGRETDNELKNVVYKVNKSVVSENDIEEIGSIDGANVVISKELSNKKKTYDTTLDRDLNKYIDKYNRYQRRVNATIDGGGKWINVSSLKDDGSFVTFNNPNNNFNKIVGKVGIKEIPDKYKDSYGYTEINIYDEEVYRRFYDKMEVMPIYTIDSFDEGDIINFSFTFNRSINKLKFMVKTEGDEYKPVVYLKNLTYGFSDKAFREELEEKTSNSMYSEYLDNLYEYFENNDEYLEYMKSEEMDDYKEYDDWNDVDLYDKNYKDELDREISRDYDKEQQKIDKVTGPAFDKDLKNIKDDSNSGPAFSTISEAINDKNTGPAFDKELNNDIKIETIDNEEINNKENSVVDNFINDIRKIMNIINIFNIKK